MVAMLLTSGAEHRDEIDLLLTDVVMPGIYLRSTAGAYPHQG